MKLVDFDIRKLDLDLFIDVFITYKFMGGDRWYKGQITSFAENYINIKNTKKKTVNIDGFRIEYLKVIHPTPASDIIILNLLIEYHS